MMPVRSVSFAVSCMVAGAGGTSCVANLGISLLQTHEALGRAPAQGARASPRSAPHAAGWLGWGHRPAAEDLWNMQSLEGERVFARHIPGDCFVEEDCRTAQSFESQHFDSVEAWSKYYSNAFDLGPVGLANSIRVSVGMKGDQSKRLSYVAVSAQHTCYRFMQDDRCAFNVSNLQPALLERVRALPKGSPYDAEKMQAWQSGFFARFGTHVTFNSSHGALVQALAVVDTSSESSQACLESGLCQRFGWLAPATSNLTESNLTRALAGSELCSNSSARCDSRTGATLSEMSERSTCVALGGDPLLQGKICRKTVAGDTLDDWLQGGDISSGSSAFRYSFMPLADLLRKVDSEAYSEAAQTIEKAIEFSTCKTSEDPPRWAWSESGCTCARVCENGGALDEATCTCSCRGSAEHGWTGPICTETYGSCQPGNGTQRESSARECSRQNRCDSWFSGSACKATDVCCATVFGTRCCSFGSICDCSTMGCQCILSSDF